MCLNCGFIFAWKIKVLITPFLKQILAGEMKEDIRILITAIINLPLLMKVTIHQRMLEALCVYGTSV